MTRKLENNNYDRAAVFYDRVSKLVFGSAIDNAQKELVKFPFSGNRIIIAGGGTGLLLEELAKMPIASLQITFVELSEKMLQLARRRNAGHHKVTFVRSAIEDFPLQHEFDVVITPFLFDNFNAVKAKHVFDHLDKMVSPGGIWLFADFYLAARAPVWQRLLLRLMYLFFKIIAKVEARRLPEIDHLFHAARYNCRKNNFFYKGFIHAKVFEKC